MRTSTAIQSRCPLVAKLLVSSALSATLLLPTQALAQDSEASPAVETGEPIIVTGSRIRRDVSDESAPLEVVGEADIDDRGYISASALLNELTSNTPSLAQAPGNGDSSGNGQQAPDLFGLGAGRTLTLVNGRRMVTTTSGLGDAQVDANIIPLGLIDRVEVVQGGGAAVYGSDAIAGVVNYVLKDDFEGIELDAQSGISSRGDYHTYSLRGTFGTSFADGRGNIALDVGYAHQPSLRFGDRPLSGLGRITVSNPENTGPDDGIPAVSELFDARFWEFNESGLLFTIPAPFPIFLLSDNGQPLQLSQDGTGFTAYDAGSDVGIPFSSGGDGYRFTDLVGLRTGIDRFTANAVAHYDVADNVTLNAEFLYANTKATEIAISPSYTILNNGSYAGQILVLPFNPYLTDEMLGQIAQSYPAFFGGAPLFLSKIFPDLLPSNEVTYETDTWRGVLGLEGDFALADRDFYWSVSGSYARVEGKERGWQVDNAKFDNAIFSIDVGGGPVCLINIDGDPGNDDAGCVTINPFGVGNVSEAARNYVSVRAGSDYTNKQADFLATLGGDLFDLPPGALRFSLAYEHRDERASFVPLEANQLGLFGTGVMEVPQAGKYNTDEFSGELLVPLIGDGMGVPLVQSLELSLAGRIVDNSAAGKENVWDVGLRWQPVEGVTLRGSRSRNFRAPTLTQLFAPSSTALEAIGQDPCDADRINGGPDPELRYANCLADFEANPGYGVLPDGSNAGDSAADRLAGFQDGAENFLRAAITTGGNADLRNEISDTLTYGIVLQPDFVPGLTITADRIEIDLEDGLLAFDTQGFAEACYDTTSRDAAFCNAFERIANPDVVNSGGSILVGRTTTFNAGVVKYRGEVYTLDYRLPLADGAAGVLHLGVSATHNALLTTSVNGENFVRSDDTYLKPDWEGRLSVDWEKGPVRLSYRGYYLDGTRSDIDATIETTPIPRVKSNLTHSISGQVDIWRMTFRLGVDNLTDEGPSYPRISYGDILGRRFWVGAKIRM